ncbi:MAG TPA: 4-hydroxy-tetrahydrodipicolinate synthase [Gammaproteobacteria bacterium]|nr:4-hydroxy-tetrahydrodipicolinate synthase [Gammaproteobacteria bacterium]
MTLEGSIVAIVTPMHTDGSIDKKALAELVDWHIQSGTAGIVTTGTTGESVTLDADEQYDLVSTIVKQVNKRMPVIAGTGTSSTKQTLKLTENAKRAGADACLIVTPSYNRPPQNGMYAHYKTIAEQAKFPIILYNVPSRTASDLLPDTVERLSKVPYIIGIKEATDGIERMREIMSRCGNDFLVYSGNDSSALSAIGIGARGVISVTANVAPLKMQQMCSAALGGELDLAAKLDAELALLHKDLFIEANPIPTKWCLQQMGKIGSGIRLPLIPLNEQYHARLKAAMQHAGILES